MTSKGTEMKRKMTVYVYLTVFLSVKGVKMRTTGNTIQKACQRN
jgi:hypothetical protein